MQKDFFIGSSFRSRVTILCTEPGGRKRRGSGLLDEIAPFLLDARELLAGGRQVAIKYFDRVRHEGWTARGPTVTVSFGGAREHRNLQGDVVVRGGACVRQ